MPRAPLTSVVAHWSKLFENFEASPKEFYAVLEKSLFERRVPGLEVSRVTWSESGALSPDRQYLRVTGDHHCYDICAAPFGTGFFFSSWLTRPQARWVFLYGLGFIACVIALVMLFAEMWKPIRDQTLGLVFEHPLLGALMALIGSNVALVPVAVLLLMWLIALAARSGRVDAERAMLAVPFAGWVYGELFAPATYYRIDTTLMFQAAVHAALMEAIDGQATLKGVRGLSEDERKPVFRKLI